MLPVEVLLEALKMPSLLAAVLKMLRVLARLVRIASARVAALVVRRGHGGWRGATSGASRGT